jgi:hypothetical protein
MGKGEGEWKGKGKGNGEGEGDRGRGREQENGTGRGRGWVPHSENHAKVLKGSARLCKTPTGKWNGKGKGMGTTL